MRPRAGRLEELKFVLPCLFGRDPVPKLVEARLPDTKPAVLETLRTIPEHIQPFTLVTRFNPIGLCQDRNGSLSRLVELTNQLTGPLVFRIGYGDTSTIILRPKRIAPTFAAYCKKNEAMGIPDEVAH